MGTSDLRSSGAI